ncbi:MAG: adenosylmethionine--8-amino-7-oxononanoate transaminase [Cytophagales bacterium]
MSNLNWQQLESWDKNHVWHPFDTFKIEKNLLVERALGDKLFLSDGSVLIDAISSWWVNLHGHSNPVMNEALKKQVELLPHVIFSGFTHQPAIELTKQLLNTLSSEFSKVFFSDNGSTSTEVALKMAIQFWHNHNEKRSIILAFENGYHGDTFGAMATGGKSVYNQVFEPFMFEVKHIPIPSDALQLEKCLEQIRLIEKTGKIAAFIYEPLLQGAAGMKTYPAKHLDSVLKVLKSQSVICIADEVFTGFFRTGTFWASDQCETKPDIICASKGLTGGYMPMGATITTQRIFDAFDGDNLMKTFMHGHSYTGNPLACSLGVASLELLKELKTQSRIQHLVKSNADWHQSTIEKRDDLSIRTIGTIIAVEKNSKNNHYFSEEREKLYHKSLSKGILMRPIGKTLYIVPMYCTSDDTVAFLRESILEII